MDEILRLKIYERLDYYSDRFRSDGECGAKTTGCRDITCDNRHRHFTDKNLYHNYAGFYADLISSKVVSPADFSLMELGIARGGSIAAWCESMPEASIVGVDKDLSLMWIEPHKYNNLKLLCGYHGEYQTYLPIMGKKFDIIIDDGSHQSSEQIQNFYTLRGFLKSGGIYVVEDVYPSNTYADGFLDQFELQDFSAKTGRFDDRVLTYTNK
jgi:hypothetical protein